VNYVRNAWYVASWSQDLVEAKPFGLSILDEPIVIWRSGGRIAALEDRCVHRLAPLSLGRCEGHQLRCQYHGFKYDPDGRVVEIPGQEVVPPQARVRNYPVAERHSWIWVWMGDPALADEALIPPAVGFEDPQWILGRGQLDYAAEARLINDNLLDFSHLPYVHAASFGAPASFAATLPRLTVLPRGVRYERWTEGTAARTAVKGPPMDGYMTYDFLVPGVLLMWNGAFPLGTARACNFGVPDLAQAAAGVTFTSQSVTPLAPRKARYFFSWGPHRQHGDEAMRDGLMQLAAKAFGEDKDIIEAQQRVIDQTAHPRIFPSAHDRGVTMFTKLVNRMIREETPDAGRESQPDLLQHDAASP
jgi:phenylpropionate dioxygenase-like ring-hydroxylating dioxygenase large terminal subunit